LPYPVLATPTFTPNIVTHAQAALFCALLFTWPIYSSLTDAIVYHNLRNLFEIFPFLMESINRKEENRGYLPLMNIPL